MTFGMKPDKPNRKNEDDRSLKEQNMSGFDLIAESAEKDPTVRAYFLGARDAQDLPKHVRDMQGDPEKQQQYIDYIKRASGDSTEPKLPNIPDNQQPANKRHSETKKPKRVTPPGPRTVVNNYTFNVSGSFNDTGGGDIRDRSSESYSRQEHRREDRRTLNRKDPESEDDKYERFISSLIIVLAFLAGCLAYATSYKVQPAENNPIEDAEMR